MESRGGGGSQGGGRWSRNVGLLCTGLLLLWWSSSSEFCDTQGMGSMATGAVYVIGDLFLIYFKSQFHPSAGPSRELTHHF